MTTEGDAERVRAQGEDRWGLWTWVGLLVVLLLATAWRWALWTRYRFREDEALYAYWAWLVYSGIDVMLEQAAVDKPPLFPYIVARLFQVFTPSEAAARLPNLWAATLSVPLMYGWARALFGVQVAWRAALLYAAMPLAVLMAPTAYTDTVMMGWTLLSAWAATRGRPHPLLWAVVSGLAFGAGVVTKPFALLWAPLIWYSGWARGLARGLWWLAWVLGVAYPLGEWWRWEQLRAGPTTLTLAVVHYGGVGWSAPALWGERLRQWVEVAAAASGGWVALIGGVLFWGWGGLFAGRVKGTSSRGVWAWTLGVGGGYVVSTLAPWDRYLLVLAPPGVLLVAVGWYRAERRLTARGRALLLAIVMVWVLGTGVRAAQAAYPVGGDHGAYDGIDHLSAYIMAELPRGGIVYHRWLGWHYGFYLFGAPYDYRWWSDIDWLVTDASRGDGVPRVIVFPAWTEAARQCAVARLRAAGVTVDLVRRVYSPTGMLRFYLYRLQVTDKEVPPSPHVPRPCTWPGS